MLIFIKKKYTVTNIFINGKKDKEVYININPIVESVFKSQCEVLYQFDGQIIVINSWDKEKTDDEILEEYRELRDLLQTELKYDIFISVGSSVNMIDDLRKSYMVAKKLKKYMLTEGMNRVVNEKMISVIKHKDVKFRDEIEQINKLMIEKIAQR